MSEPEDQETPGSIPNPTYTGPAPEGLPGLMGVDPAGSSPTPGGLPLPPGSQPLPSGAAPEGGWYDSYVAGLEAPADGGGPMHLENLATLLSGPGATMAGGGHFRIDPELAPQAIADLKNAVQLLRAEVDNAEQLANYSAPGLDAVSKDAVDVISYAAIGGQGSLRAALEGAMAEFANQAQNLEDDLKDYLRVEDVNVPSAREIDL